MATKKERLKDPKGGLTAAGRRKYNRETGSNLKAGVRGKADTPEKMRRKGSFLTRFFTNPSGPMVKPNGEPSRLALSAHAWGEPVPKNRSDAARLAEKGRRLLERYEKTKVEKYNPHHDELGRFTSGGSSSRVVPKRINETNAPSQLKVLADKGGFTFNPRKNELRRKGIAVAVSKNTEAVYTEQDFSQNGDKYIREYMKDNAQFLSQPLMHLGAWKDKGNVYLDISKVVSSLSEAGDIGRKHDQIGIFDLSTFTTWSRVKSKTGGQYRYFPAPQNGVSPVNSNLGLVLSSAGLQPHQIGKADTGIIYIPVESLDDFGINAFFDKVCSMLPISKEDPSSSEVHVDSTNWKAGKPVKRKKKKTISKEEIAKKTKQLKEKTCPNCGEPMSMCKCDMENMSKYNPHHDELGRFTSGGGGKQMRRNAMPRGSFGRAAQLFTRTKLAVAGGIPEAKALKNKGKKKKSGSFDFDQYRLANPGLRVLARPTSMGTDRSDKIKTTTGISGAEQRVASAKVGSARSLTGGGKRVHSVSYGDGINSKDGSGGELHIFHDPKNKKVPYRIEAHVSTNGGKRKAVDISYDLASHGMNEGWSYTSTYLGAPNLKEARAYTKQLKRWFDAPEPSRTTKKKKRTPAQIAGAKEAAKTRRIRSNPDYDKRARETGVVYYGRGRWSTPAMYD